MGRGITDLNDAYDTRSWNADYSSARNAIAHGLFDLCANQADSLTIRYLDFQPFDQQIIHRFVTSAVEQLLKVPWWYLTLQTQ